MKRILITAAATAFSMIALVSTASAAVVELGATSSPLVAPICPPAPPKVKLKNCTIILTQATALETLRDGVAYPTVKVAGRIVAFTVGLSRLTSSRTTTHNIIHALDQAYGGTARVAITVLRRVGPARLRHWKVVAESPAFHVQPYLGQVVQFPLSTSLPVRPGDVVALTTPTWAPVLSIKLNSSKFAYRQSRSTACGPPPTTSVAQSVGQTATYGCDYPGTRVEYTATEVTNPVAVNPIHGPNRRPS